MVAVGGGGTGFNFRTRTTEDAKLLQAEHELNRRFRFAPTSRRVRLIGTAIIAGLMVAGIVGKVLAGL